MILLAFVLVAPAMPAPAQSIDDNLTIMRPEPGSPEARRHKAPKVQRPAETVTPPDTAKAPPKGKKRIGSSSPVYPTPLPPPLHYNPPPVSAVVPPSNPAPPSLYVPQTGLVLPNLPAPGTGSNETAQDRASRCAHQAGVYGPNMTGDRNGYIGSCINQ